MTTLVVVIAIALPMCSDRNASGAEYETPENLSRAEGQLTSGQVDANRMRPQKMREGTLVPQTVGRFVPAGRRWMFIPDSVAGGMHDVVVTDPRSREETPSNVFRSTSAGFGSLQSSRNDNAGLWRGDQHNRLRESISGDYSMGQDAHLIGKPDPLVSVPVDGNPIGLPQIVAVENLMLQRIVEAIRVDGADDRWTISGQLTEYFDENRLQVRTAERATSK